MIEIRNLLFRYGDQPAADLPAAGFDAGKVHGIVGLNGAGKTTFFNLLAGYLRPEQGTLTLNGSPLTGRDTGFLETNNYFYSNLTGGEYLRIFPRTNTAFNLETLNALFRLPLDQLVSGYSTGMKKKLALLAVLQQDKPVYILDEPFNGLDMESNKVLELIVGQLREKGKTVFLSSHILSPLLQACDHIHIMEQGKLIRSYDRAQFGDIERELFGHFSAEAAAAVRSGL